MSAQETQATQAWHEIVCDTLKRNSLQLVTYVPDDATLKAMNRNPLGSE